MEFQVKLTANAKREIETAYLWLKQNNPVYADQWFRFLMNAIATLQDKPRRCALARENDDFPEEIRQFIFGKSKNKYRIIFTIRDDMVGSPLFCVITHAYGLMESFHSNPFAVIFSRLVISMTHFPHS